MPTEIASDEYLRIKSKILNSRDAGKTTFNISLLSQEDRFDEKRLLRSYLESVGFLEVQEDLSEIERSHAEFLTKKFLSEDLAYGGKLKSEEIKEEVFHFLEGEVKPIKYFTNRNLLPGEPFESWPPDWMPISNSTFDMAVVYLGKEKIAILAVEDED